MPITNVPNTSTPNAGRVSWNNSDTSLQAEIDADEAALTTHKTSSDHDGRYFTEGESDARFAPIAEPLLTTHKTSSDHDGRYFTETESDARFAPIAEPLLTTHKMAATLDHPPAT